MKSVKVRRSKASPNYITVNICSSVSTPAKQTRTVSTPTSARLALKTPVKTPNKTPMKTPMKTPVKTPLPTPVQTPLKTPVQTPLKTPLKTPVKTPVSTSKSYGTRLNQQANQTNQLQPQADQLSAEQQAVQDENRPTYQSPACVTRKTRAKLAKAALNGRQSLGTPVSSYRTPSPAPYYLRRQNKSSVFSMCTMSDSKLERKPQQLKRSIQDDNNNTSDPPRNENSVTVAIRVRPLNSRERNPENANLPIVVNSESNTIKVKDRNSESFLEFSFDHTFNSTKPSSPDYVSQERVYLEIGKPLFERIFNGINVSVFCYGQTGSGKSHTIMGTNDNNGLIPRFAREFFNQTKSHEKKLVIEASYYEIYNEKIHDLLTDVKHSDEKQALKIREKPGSGPYVENLSLHMISSVEDLFAILIKGNKNKATAATMMNDRSSRSHVTFSLNVYEQKPCKNEENSAKKKTCIQLLSKINFIDLAGSERASVIGSTGDRLKEGNLINKSLLTLGKVITLLSENQTSSSQHIPYRESALTYLLKDCLGGNSYTCMIATISPSVENLEESLSTLRYASKARRIVNKIKQNRPLTDNVDVEQMEVEYEQKLGKLSEQLKSDLQSLKQIVLGRRRVNLVDAVNELFGDMLD